jgi:hypothetical protein
MPAVDEELWVIPDVMIIIVTHADIRSTSQEKPRYENLILNLLKLGPPLLSEAFFTSQLKLRPLTRSVGSIDLEL